MRQWNARVVAIALILCAAGEAQGQTSSPWPVLFERCKWTRVEIVLGRLAAVNAGCTESRSYRASDPKTGWNQTLVVTVRDGQASIRFRHSTKRQRVAVDIRTGNQVLLTMGAVDSAEPRVSYRQPSIGDVELIVRTTPAREYREPSLWHLWLAHPHVCRRYLLPLLQRMRPNWQLDAQAGRIERELLANVEDWRDPTSELDTMVAQLASPIFRERQTADLDLRARGYTALSYLRQLDTKQLDAEQRHRLRGVLRALAFEEGDTPQRMSAWLADDPQIWLTFARRDSLRTRTIAARHLHKIWAGPLEFDPAASPGLRRRQVARLRGQLLRR